MKTLILAVGAVLAALLFWILRRQGYLACMICNLGDSLAQSYPMLRFRTREEWIAHMDRWYADRDTKVKETATA